MLWKLQLLVSITASIVSVVLSTNIVVVRQLNPDTTRPPFADLFSNQQCSSSACAADRSTCAGGSCCMCQCLYDYPNVFMNGTILRCTNYGEMNRMSSAYCQYSFRRPNEPLEVIPLTEIASGKIQFRIDQAGVDCAENSLSVNKWQYLDVEGRWENGKGNIFVVDFRTVGGSDSNQKELTFLDWNAMLDAKYAGLIIKLFLSCAGRNAGCILAKINGTYTSPRKPGTSGAPILESTSTISVKEQQSSDSKTANSITVPVLIAVVVLVGLISLVCSIVVLYKRRKRRLLERRDEEPEAAGPELENDQDPIYAEPDDPQTSDNPLYCKQDPVRITTDAKFMKRSKLDPLPSLPGDARNLLIEREA